MSDEDEDDKVEKWCRFCGKKEGATSTKKFCGEAEDDSGAHSFIQREVVEASITNKYSFACGSCPDAKAYPGGSRPYMKTSSGGRTCRNSACTKYKKPEVKHEVKAEAKAPTPKPRTRPGRAPKHYLDRLKYLEREEKRVRTEELEPLQLDLVAWQHLVASYEETGEAEADEAVAAGAAE